MKFNLFLLSLCLLLTCDKNKPTMLTMPHNLVQNKTLSYLALGDSYTIGESVPQSLNFPYQLVSELAINNLQVNVPKIIAKTGWTTKELQDAIKTENLATTYDIVTLLIGVNNQYRGYSQSAYQTEFKQLLNTAIAFAKGDKSKVFVVSIPDWGVTPFGKTSAKSTAQISEEINAFNAVNKEETLALGISYTDITVASRNAANDNTLLASDGLHPSGKMYAEWAQKVAPSILKVLK